VEEFANAFAKEGTQGGSCSTNVHSLEYLEGEKLKDFRGSFTACNSSCGSHQGGNRLAAICYGGTECTVISMISFLFSVLVSVSLSFSDLCNS